MGPPSLCWLKMVEVSMPILRWRPTATLAAAVLVLLSRTSGKPISWVSLSSLETAGNVISKYPLGMPNPKFSLFSACQHMPTHLVERFLDGDDDPSGSSIKVTIHVGNPLLGVAWTKIERALFLFFSSLDLLGLRSTMLPGRSWNCLSNQKCNNKHQIFTCLSLLDTWMYLDMTGASQQHASTMAFPGHRRWRWCNQWCAGGRRNGFRSHLQHRCFGFRGGGPRRGRWHRSGSLVEMVDVFKVSMCLSWSCSFTANISIIPSLWLIAIPKFLTSVAKVITPPVKYLRNIRNSEHTSNKYSKAQVEKNYLTGLLASASTAIADQNKCNFHSKFHTYLFKPLTGEHLKYFRSGTWISWLISDLQVATCPWKTQSRHGLPDGESNMVTC